VSPVVPSSTTGQPLRHRPAPSQTRDDMIEERPIRVGKIQWPPPRVDEAKPEVQVGRLDIEEGNEKNLATSTRPSADVIRQRLHDRISSARQNEPSSASASSLQVCQQRCFVRLRTRVNLHRHRHRLVPSPRRVGGKQNINIMPLVSSSRRSSSTDILLHNVFSRHIASQQINLVIRRCHSP